MTYWWLIPLVAGVSLVLTTALRRYALARRIIDIPNARSSHSIPIPRGGEVTIVLAFLLVLPILAWVELVPAAMLVAAGGAGALVAVVGFMDDHGHIAVFWRLLGHLRCSLGLVLAGRLAFDQVARADSGPRVAGVYSGCLLSCMDAQLVQLYGRD